jgi:hypothetical protein
VLAGRQRRALDSTLLDDAVATQDTVTQLVATIRRVRRLVPAAAALELAAHDYDHDPGKPACAWDDAEARDRLVSALVTDALAVLGEIQDGDLDAIQTEAVGLLGLVAGQDVEPGEVEGRWRIAGKVAADRVISTVDPDAPAHAQEPQQLPRRLQGASGRGTRDRAGDRGRAHPGHRRRWPHRGGVAGRRGTRAPGAWRHRLRERGDPGGATGGRACPAHQADPLGSGRAGRLHPRRLHRRPPGRHGDLPGRPHRGHHPWRPGGVRLALWPLPAATRCTRAKDGKTLTLGPHDAELVAARRQATTPAFQASYRRWRPMVERSIAWLVAGGHRRVRYRGLARNQHGLSVRVAAINLRRLVRMGLDHHAGGWVLA